MPGFLPYPAATRSSGPPIPGSTTAAQQAPAALACYLVGGCPPRPASTEGHTEAVLAVSFSPDGKCLASGSGDTTVRFWDLSTQTPLFTCKGHKNWVLCIAWSPDGKHLVSGSKSGELILWDPKTGKQLGSPLTDFICSVYTFAKLEFFMNPFCHTNAVTCVKWGGDGLIYTGSEDCSIKVWETSQGKLVKTLQAALMRYKKMRGNAPERLVSGSDDFTMFLWEPTISKQPKARMTGHQKLVNHVYFSPDGQWLASASFDKSVKLWNGITGKFVAAFRGHVADVYQISWSADSRLLLSGSKDSTLKVWDIRTHKLKQDLPGHADEYKSVLACLFSDPKGFGWLLPLVNGEQDTEACVLGAEEMVLVRKKRGYRMVQGVIVRLDIAFERCIKRVPVLALGQCIKSLWVTSLCFGGCGYTSVSSLGVMRTCGQELHL
ncbi:hypothetical protein PR202_gb21095 [Eleusine coracana subsp. coracana]|uniref:Uncharacterized protein n=1 Tax=Eleusine coracana subsp. coracana TaxID=191504 RepID=A0AAV5FE97_ELECO|nr:hypothetical protein PR202_gb21095 [Eleusine coracana subsp. coracana]